MSRPITPFAGTTCLVAGHLTHDRYGDQIAAGGSALYAAKTFLGMGGTVGIATAAGPDFQFAHELRECRVFKTPSQSTSTFENTYPKEAPRLMLVEHPAATIMPDDLPEQWRSPEVLFLAPVIGEIPLRPWLNQTSARTVGIGLQGFLKRQGPRYKITGTARRLAKNDFSPTDALLRRLFAVFLSEEDLLGYADADLLERLKSKVAVTVVTRGKLGARLFTRDAIFNVGIYDTTTEDPTGAGDTFASAFLIASARGQSIPEAAKLAAAAASVVVEARGSEASARISEAFGRAHAVFVCQEPVVRVEQG